MFEPYTGHCEPSRLTNPCLLAFTLLIAIPVSLTEIFFILSFNRFILKGVKRNISYVVYPVIIESRLHLLQNQ